MIAYEQIHRRGEGGEGEEREKIKCALVISFPNHVRCEFSF